ncbi:disease resistance protein RRS1-like [Quercus lobata]|uniref:disease resistance protein RRS1-like n=1 Tax=Quercus lobata TaxID=97700 RepID=UPI001243E42A|nr:disease resistance protein RRS1-like [Quercus lobata]
MGLNDVRIIGVWEMGGIGKTTLARVVFHMVSNKFEGCCFLANVREVYEKEGLVRLQEQFILQIFNESMSILDVCHGVSVIKNRLRHKRILLVLDDVNQLDQINKLAEKRIWFGSGSRVIITTRDRHLLEILEVDEIFDVEGLNYNEALHLLSLKAFKKVHPPKDYIEVSKDIVYYANGLPLAIEILGSFLFGRSIDKWKSTLNKLKEFPNNEILEVLKISFNGLDEAEKEIFLHIACFFNHKIKNDVVKILAYLHLSPNVGMEVLVEKSLIKVRGNRLWMHDLLQEMGRHIVYQECPKEPGKRSRLWSFWDINNVLTINKGTEAVQGIVLEFYVPEKVDWNPEAFSKLQYLKLLKICGVHLTNDLKHLPNSLRFLDWKGYPSKSLPSSFQSNELVELCMCCSHIERLWKGTRSFEMLKCIKLTKSQKLIGTPDIIKVPNLMTLVLEDWIKKSLKISLSPTEKYEIVIPGSEIPEWFRHQSIGVEVNIKQPSHLYNEWMGIVVCIVFCSHDVDHQISCLIPLYCPLTANGKRMSPALGSSLLPKVLPDHLWLLYVTPQFFDEKSNKLLSEGDENGFTQIGIKIETGGPGEEVKKCGFHMIYNKDIEGLDRTMAQHSNSSISPYESLAVIVECDKAK